MSKFSRRAFLAGAASYVALGASLERAQAQRTTVSAKFDLDRFIEDVKRANKEQDRQTAVQEVLQRAVSEPGAVLGGLGAPTDVGLKSLYRGDDLTILNVVWAPFMVLLPHNHNMWASIGIYTGREDNIVWQRQGAVIEAATASALSEKEIFGLPSDAIHSVTNPIGKLTGAIHIYGGDFFAPGRSEWDAETLRERPFDLERARQVFIDANERFKATR